MRVWEIVRWNGMQLEKVQVVAGDAMSALNQLMSGAYDTGVISVTEIPAGE